MDYQWAAIVPGYYAMQTKVQGGPVSILNIGNGLTDVLASGSSNQLNHYVRELSDGVYTLRFINDGAGPVAISWVLNVASLDWEKIIGNGVGQSSALSLSLFSPISGDSANSWR